MEQERFLRTWLSAMAETAAAGFQVLRPKDRKETVEMLFSMSERMCLCHSLGARPVADFMADERVPKIDFADFNRHVTTSAMEGPETVGSLTERMLFQIPGMGKEMVRLYLAAFPTITHLAEELRGCLSPADAATRLRAKAHTHKPGSKVKPNEVEQTIFGLFCTTFK